MLYFSIPQPLLCAALYYKVFLLFCPHPSASWIRRTGVLHSHPGPAGGGSASHWALRVARSHVRVYKRSVTFTDRQNTSPRATKSYLFWSETSNMLSLKAFLSERLAAAAEEIFGAVEKTIAEYKEEISRSKDVEISRLRMQLKLLKSGWWMESACNQTPSSFAWFLS